MLRTKETGIGVCDTIEVCADITISDTPLCSLVVYGNDEIDIHYSEDIADITALELISELQIKESIPSLVFKAMDTPCELTIEDNGLDVSLGIVADDKQTTLVAEEAEECVFTMDNEGKECVLTSYEPLCVFSLTEDCTVEELTEIVWLYDNLMPILWDNEVPICFDRWLYDDGMVMNWDNNIEIILD